MPLTPNQAAQAVADRLAATPNGRLGVVSKPGISIWDTFFSKVYSVDAINNAANGIINTGNKVREVNQQVVDATKATAKAAGTGLKWGLEFGPTILVVFIGLYFLYPLLLSRR